MHTKKCTKCTFSKPVTEFYKKSDSPDGLRTHCKSCVKEYQIENKERIRKYKAELQNNPEYKLKKKDYNKNYNAVKKAEISVQKASYYAKNRDKKIKEVKIYRIKNPDKVRARINKRYKIRIKQDINFRLSMGLRARLNAAIKANVKKGSAVRDLGCSIEYLKQYLEAKFQPGMSWENYGIRGWHIDHIIPLSSFNLQNREELLKACHYSNLQPLWAIENIKKSNKVA